ncbi:MAG: proline dehydrogenase family protein [Candidatus Cyclobacteriaceae bacterium M3_2C_046]
MINNSDISFDNTEIAFQAKSNYELRKAYWLFMAMNSNFFTKLGTNLVKISLILNLPIKNIIKQTIFRQFCGGENIPACESTIQDLSRFHIRTILDYAVEGEDNEAGFEATCQEILKTIEKAKSSPDIPFSVFKPTGIASKGLLEKVQNKEDLTRAEQQAFENIRQRFDRICQKAYQENVRLFIDSEDSWYQDPIDQLIYEMMKRYNQKKVIVYNTYQMYRVNMMDNLRKAFHYAATYNYNLGAKLVRGAYMEKERERAQEKNYPDPILPDKATTDQAYDDALKFCIDNKQRIALCSGSHNENSNYYLMLLMEKYEMKRNDENVYFAQLYGMSDHISYNLANAGYNVVKYVPYGPVKAVIPYLLRRAEENTSIAGQSSREFMLIKKELSRRNEAGLM